MNLHHKTVRCCSFVGKFQTWLLYILSESVGGRSHSHQKNAKCRKIAGGSNTAGLSSFSTLSTWNTGYPWIRSHNRTERSEVVDRQRHIQHWFTEFANANTCALNLLFHLRHPLLYSSRIYCVFRSMYRPCLKFYEGGTGLFYISQQSILCLMNSPQPAKVDISSRALMGILLMEAHRA